jgi:hypothetical protein
MALYSRNSTNALTTYKSTNKHIEQSSDIYFISYINLFYFFSQTKLERKQTRSTCRMHAIRSPYPGTPPPAPAPALACSAARRSLWERHRSGRWRRGQSRPWRSSCTPGGTRPPRRHRTGSPAAAACHKNRSCRSTATTSLVSTRCGRTCLVKNVKCACIHSLTSDIYIYIYIYMKLSGAWKDSGYLCRAAEQRGRREEPEWRRVSAEASSLLLCPGKNRPEFMPSFLLGFLCYVYVYSRGYMMCMVEAGGLVIYSIAGDGGPACLEMSIPTRSNI